MNRHRIMSSFWQGGVLSSFGVFSVQSAEVFSCVIYGISQWPLSPVY